jgi:hypothetical protein
MRGKNIFTSTPVIVASAVLMLASAALVAPAPGRAARPAELRDVVDTVGVDLMVTESGALTLSLGVTSLSGGAVDFAYWLPGTDPAGIARYIAMEEPIQRDGDRLTGTLTVLDGETHEPVGQASIDITLTPAGPAEAIAETGRFGNTRIRTTVTTQEMAVQGFLILPNGAEFDLSTADALRTTYERWATQPKATVGDGFVLTIECSWQSSDTFAALTAQATAIDDAASLFVRTATNDFVGGDPDPALGSEGLQATFELFGGEESGAAEAAATFTETGEPTTYVDQVQDSRAKVIAQQLIAEGTVTVRLPGDTLTFPLDDASCDVLHEDFHAVLKVANGPAPDAPVNDAPDRALPLNPGGVANVLTGGAAAAGEELTDCLVRPGDPPEILPFAHTVWYTFRGTGGRVTLDTAGSDFDTVIAVYRRGADGLDELACGDDVALEPVGLSRQASVTLATERGTTYYVQAGGFINESGRLRVRLSAV